MLRDLLDAGTEVVCLVGKAWDLHVTEALRTDLDEGVAMVRDSVAFLRAEGRRVFFDAEHFFDGYRPTRRSRSAVLAAAEEAGAERLVLCDTNGGMLPFDVARIVAEVTARVGTPLGIHVHNDAGCAVANSLIAVDARRAPGAGRRSTATASGPATPTWCRSPRTSCSRWASRTRCPRAPSGT